MEFPTLGNNCAHLACKQLDFLPMKCDACSQIFCKNHIQYSTHNCTESYKKDKQVPVCPLCNKPIPLKPGELADVKVGAHIDSDCLSDPAKERRKVYVNRCNKKGCKVKEMVRVVCERCQKNYCLKHRHENDHDCTGSVNNSPSTARSRAAAAAIARSNQSGQSTSRSSSKPTVTQPQSSRNPTRSVLPGSRNSPSHSRQPVPLGTFQGGLTEDEALQRALQLSVSEPQSPPSNTDRSKQQQEEDDLALAQAIAASENETRMARQTSSREKSSCLIN